MGCTWKTEMVKITRVLLWDITEPLKYTDGRLEDVLVVAAQYVNQDIQLPQHYDIDIGNVIITPDPMIVGSSQTGSNTKDEAFINFTCLKAACIGDISNLRNAAFQEGVRIVCGPTQMAVNGRVKGFQTLIEKGPCAAYEEMKQDWLFGNGFSIQAILTPFVSNKFDPSLLSYNYDYNTDYYGGNRI